MQLYFISICTLTTLTYLSSFVADLGMGFPESRPKLAKSNNILISPRDVEKSPRQSVTWSIMDEPDERDHQKLLGPSSMVSARSVNPILEERGSGDCISNVRGREILHMECVPTGRGWAQLDRLSDSPERDGGPSF